MTEKIKRERKKEVGPEPLVGEETACPVFSGAWQNGGKRYIYSCKQDGLELYCGFLLVYGKEQIMLNLVSPFF